MTLCELGCGIGKACFTAMVTQNFHSVLGVEDQGALLQVGSFLKAGFQSHMEALWGFKTPPEFMLAEGTIMDSDWWSAGSDIYICHTTLWDPDDVAHLSSVLESELVPRGTVVITFSVQLTAFEDSQSSMHLLHACDAELCWGTASVFIYQKADPVFIDIPSPREKAKNRNSNSNSDTAPPPKKDKKAFFPDTESDDEDVDEEEGEIASASYGEGQDFGDRPKTSRGRSPRQQEESPRPKTSRGRTSLEEESPRPKTSRGPSYRSPR